MALRIDPDHRRFRDIVRGKIKQDLRKYISQGELIGRKGKDLVSIPLPQINVPRFRFGSKDRGGVGQGEGEVGDSLGKGDPNADGSGKAGDQAGEHALEVELSLEERGLGETLTMFGEMFRRRVKDQPERLGCPVAAAALARPEDPALAAAATAAFQSWEAPIAAALRDEGIAPREAETFAGLVVSTIEGALVRARAAGDQAPLDSAVAGLHQALDSLLTPPGSTT